MRTAPIAALAAFLSSSAPAATDADVERLMRIAVGEFSNKPHVEAARAKARPGEAIPEPVRDIHHMYATEVAMPKLKGRVIYVEWRHDGPEGAISGQRVWTFNPAPEGVAMMFHTLKDTGKAILNGVVAPAEKTAQVAITDLRPYPDSCLIFFQSMDGGFVGENRPGQCAFARTGAPDETFKVDAVLKFMPGFHSEKTIVWITKANEPPGAPTEDEEWVYDRIR
jgi:hypothetical protein